MRQDIFKVNAPNLNGRVYSAEVMQRMLAELPSFVPIQRALEEDGTPVLINTVGEAKEFAIEVRDSGTVVTAECSFNQPDWTDMVQQGSLHVVSSGIGELDEQADGTKIVRGYTLCYLFLTTDPA